MKIFVRAVAATVSVMAFLNIAYAEVRLPVCNQKSIHQVNAPIYAESPSLGTFKYHYQLIKKGEPDSPVVIIIPGGPGGTSIGPIDESLPFDFNQIQWGLPNRYNAIFTDPRTTGCNSLNLPNDSLSTENVASDIVAIIKSLGLKKYILYGHSYGSVVATWVAAEAARQNFPAPIAVVLTGTLGRAMKNGEQEAAIDGAWQKLRARLSPFVASQFPVRFDDFQIEPKPLLGFPPTAWSALILNGLTEGSIYLNGVQSFSVLDQLNSINENVGVPEKLKAQLTDLKGKGESNLKSVPIFLRIMCQELVEPDEGCKEAGIPSKHLYNSNEHQIPSPIYYIHGENDPAVPHDSALFHFDSQTNPLKTFIEISDGGHANVLALNDCKEGFWNAVFKNCESLLSQSFQTCPSGVHILKKGRN